MIDGLQGSANASYDNYGYGNYGTDRINGDENKKSAYGVEEKDSQKKQEISELNKECQTCKNRKYKDGSDENVSFKAAAHLSPTSAGAAVRAHEGEHVANAYHKAAQNNGKVIRASVSIQTSICPECGRTYVSGGVTNTAIKYSNEENPYIKDLKEQQGIELRGQNVDLIGD